MRSGETQSEIFPELQIIDPEMYERAQEIMAKRTQPHRDVPLNTKGKALLAGLVYCRHCGSKLVLTTNGRCRNQTTGIREQRVRYGCHYKVRHPQLCDGQSGYGMTKLDAIVEQVIKTLFERIKATLIAETKEQIDVAQTDMENAQAEIDGYEQLSTMIEARYDKITTWADLFADSIIEAKKMIVAQLIKQIRVGRDYEMEIDLNVNYEMFSGMLQEDQAERKRLIKTLSWWTQGGSNP